MKINTNINIEITNLTVVKTSKNTGWYMFDYIVSINGKSKSGNYDGTYSSQTSGSIRQRLIRGHAAELALNQVC